MILINCYAKTESDSNDIIDQFYEQLNSCFKTQVHKGDITLLLGDMNAKLGSDNDGVERYMGKHGFGNRNDNGRQKNS